MTAGDKMIEVRVNRIEADGDRKLLYTLEQGIGHIIAKPDADVQVGDIVKVEKWAFTNFSWFVEVVRRAAREG